jgi:hypothetical protein
LNNTSLQPAVGPFWDPPHLNGLPKIKSSAATKSSTTIIYQQLQPKFKKRTPFAIKYSYNMLNNIKDKLHDSAVYIAKLHNLEAIKNRVNENKTRFRS